MRLHGPWALAARPARHTVCCQGVQHGTRPQLAPRLAPPPRLAGAPACSPAPQGLQASSTHLRRLHQAEKRPMRTYNAVLSHPAFFYPGNGDFRRFWAASASKHNEHGHQVIRDDWGSRRRRPLGSWPAPPPWREAGTGGRGLATAWPPPGSELVCACQSGGLKATVLGVSWLTALSGLTWPSLRGRHGRPVGAASHSRPAPASNWAGPQFGCSWHALSADIQLLHGLGQQALASATQRRPAGCAAQRQLQNYEELQRAVFNRNAFLAQFRNY